MELLDYIRKNYKTPNIAVLKTLGATDELIKYLVNTPWNTNMKIAEGLIGGDGDEDGGNGIMSITISPAITTTPALDTIRINYDDLTEEEKADGVTLSISAESGQLEEGNDYTLTITPTPNWYAAAGSPPTDPGQPVEAIRSVDDGELYYTFMVMNEISETPEKGFTVFLTIS